MRGCGVLFPISGLHKRHAPPGPKVFQNCELSGPIEPLCASLARPLWAPVGPCRLHWALVGHPGP